MNKAVRMDELKAGQKATVIKLNTTGDMRRRFIDLGLIAGTDIVCVGKSPLGDPSASLIRGAVIAIRSEDSATVDTIIME